MGKLGASSHVIVIVDVNVVVFVASVVIVISEKLSQKEQDGEIGCKQPCHRLPPHPDRRHCSLLSLRQVLTAVTQD